MIKHGLNEKVSNDRRSFCLVACKSMLSCTIASLLRLKKPVSPSPSVLGPRLTGGVLGIPRR